MEVKMRGTKVKKTARLVEYGDPPSLLKLREKHGEKTAVMSPKSLKRALRKMYKEHLINV
jgi:hypothetical protein